MIFILEKFNQNSCTLLNCSIALLKYTKYLHLGRKIPKILQKKYSKWNSATLNRMLLRVPFRLFWSRDRETFRCSINCSGFIVLIRNVHDHSRNKALGFLMIMEKFSRKFCHSSHFWMLQNFIVILLFMNKIMPTIFVILLRIFFSNSNLFFILRMFELKLRIKRNYLIKKFCHPQLRHIFVVVNAWSVMKYLHPSDTIDIYLEYQWFDWWLLNMLFFQSDFQISVWHPHPLMSDCDRIS